MLHSIHDRKLHEEMRNVLFDFYSPLKESGEMIRFLLLTGITKYSQLGIFSKLKHLTNISMMPKYAAICGISQQEIADNFTEHVKALAAANDQTEEEAWAKLKKTYDGYHFSRISPDIYNPFSLLHVLASQEYNNYWYSSGTPSFLFKLLENQAIIVDELDGIELNDTMFDAPIFDNVDLIPTLYHRGYLTIKSYDPEFMTYTLGFPNEEVRKGLIESLYPNIIVRK